MKIKIWTGNEVEAREYIKTLAESVGFEFPSPRHNYAVINDEDRSDDNYLGSYVSFDEARKAAPQFLHEGYKRISITGRNSGVIESHNLPFASSDCPVCGISTPHGHTEGEIVDFKEHRERQVKWAAEKEKELQSRVEWIDKNFAPDTELLDKLCAFSALINPALRAEIERLEFDCKAWKGLAESQAKEIEQLQAVSDLYYDLLYCVGRKHQGETRHETAKKYLINSEKPQNNVPQKSTTLEAE